MVYQIQPSSKKVASQHCRRAPSLAPTLMTLIQLSVRLSIQRLTSSSLQNHALASRTPLADGSAHSVAARSLPPFGRLAERWRFLVFEWSVPSTLAALLTSRWSLREPLSSSHSHPCRIHYCS